MHQALAAWRSPEDGFERWAAARSRECGVIDPREVAGAVRESRRLLLRFRRHGLWEEMELADRRLHEVPYSLIVADRVERGIIDATYLRQGLWTVVEFKTDDVRNEAQLRELLEAEDYLAQARRYTSAVERLLAQRPRSILCLLNCAGSVLLVPLEEGSNSGG